jgi:hypothetical protein
MPAIIESLARPGRGLLAWAGGANPKDRAEYISLVGEIYTLLGQMHGQVLRILTRAAAQPSLAEGKKVLAQIDAYNLRGDFHTMGLCDKLEKRGRQLRSSSAVLEPDWERFTEALEGREAATAALYEEELS